MDGARLEYLKGCRLVELEAECRRRLDRLREGMTFCWFQPFGVAFGMAMKGYVRVMDACRGGKGEEQLRECLSALDAVRNAGVEAHRTHVFGRQVFFEMVMDLYTALSDYAYMTWQDFSGANTRIVIGCEI